MTTLADEQIISLVTVDEAFAYCERLTRSHYENFPVASLFIPEEKRPYLQVFYAFSRIADDIADEPGLEPDERLRRLDAWESQLDRCYAGDAEHPVFVALRDTIARCGVPPGPFHDLIAAFRRDVLQQRYETFDDLLSYCRNSANPVGKLVLWLFGHTAPELVTKSDDICTALQLTNFWQDLAIDAAKDRCYLPMEDCRRFGVSLDEWKSGAMSDRFRSMMAFEVSRTRDLFRRGAELPDLVENDLKVELRLVWLGGMTILRRLERSRFDVYRRRPRFGTWGKISILLRALLGPKLTSYQQKKKAWDLT